MNRDLYPMGSISYSCSLHFNSGLFFISCKFSGCFFYFNFLICLLFFRISFRTSCFIFFPFPGKFFYIVNFLAGFSDPYLFSFPYLLYLIAVYVFTYISMSCSVYILFKFLFCSPYCTFLFLMFFCSFSRFPIIFFLFRFSFPPWSLFLFQVPAWYFVFLYFYIHPGRVPPLSCPLPVSSPIINHLQIMY